MMKKMFLRELTSAEKEDLNNIIYSSNIDTFQILLGIIAIDLFNKNDNIKQITYHDLCNKITGEDYPNYGPAALFGIIDIWIRLTMEYKGKGSIEELNISSVKGLKSSISAAVFGLSDAVCHVGSGMTGIKQKNIWNFYKHLNEQIRIEKGLELYLLPEVTFQYIVTCLDYLGLQRKRIYTKPYKVDISCITYDDLI